ncbi:hypothetical protein [Mangrovicoccus ximenensis]|uniref:hypothetical protein n=1 Tax=Mangrovicoccus ximenensis TaxID=1911570 RepID=UPI000D3A14FC|nr:hypothetical protein [Mangrovicoccus ximenensis]
MSARTLSAVPTAVDDIPEYPIEKGERLESHSFFQFHHNRYLNSDFFSLADWEVQGVALALWSLSRLQDPVGTLPTSPKLLIAKLPRMTLEAWEGLMRRDPNPLHGWVQCRVGSEIRLMHSVVTEVTLEGLARHTANDDKKKADAERKRMDRLKATVAKLGHAKLAANEMFVLQLDELLRETYPSESRTAGRVKEAMERLGVANLI